MNGERKQLDSVSTVEHVVERIRTSKRIVVITGAGISVSCGIPDFRSANGIYNTVDCHALNIPSAELLFDLSFFKIDPQPFYKFSRAFYANRALQPSPTHLFIRDMESRKKLLRNYTQNVDGIEQIAGIRSLVECHGNMHTFRCAKCKKKGDSESVIRRLLEDGSVPQCACLGSLKPDIVFFGEVFPSSLERSMQRDLARVDLVLVIGTSLRVGGSVLEFLRRLPDAVPRVLINKEALSGSSKTYSAGFDVTLLGPCDAIVRILTHRLDWPDPSKCLDRIGHLRALRERVYEVCEAEEESRVSVSVAAPADVGERRTRHAPKKRRIESM